MIKIFELLEDENELGLLNYMRDHPYVDLTVLRDHRGYTCLHVVAFKGNESLMKILLSLAKDRSL